MTIGFIGLGIMGKPMAKNLVAAGHSLVVCDINPGPVDELVSLGAKAVETPRDVARQCEWMITMLPDSPDVEAVVLGENGVIEGIGSGAVLVDMSSILPVVSQRVSAALAEKGASMLDAPVSGGEPRAVDGTLSIMVGGPEDVFDRVKDILVVMGGSVVRVGEIGSGNTVKLVNQVIVAINIAAMSEAMVLAVRAGVDPEAAYQAIRGGLAGSNVLDAKVPLALAGHFKPGFRIELHIKDLRNAINTAHDVGAPVPLSADVMEMMQMLKVAGHAGDDHGGLIQYYENLAATEVRKGK